MIIDGRQNHHRAERAYHYLAEQEKEDTARCDNGRTPFPVSELAEPENLHERLDPGGVVPAGECPLCGALAYPIDKKEGHQR